MSAGFEDALAALVAREVRPLAEALRSVRAELAELRAHLPPQLVTIAEAAERLGLSVSSIRRAMRAGTIAYRKVGRRVLVDLSRMRGLDAGDVARLANGTGKQLAPEAAGDRPGAFTAEATEQLGL